MTRGAFVTGTDTGAGKSVVTAAIAAALVADGRRVAAFKPVVTGLDEPPGDWPPDHELLGAAAGRPPEEVAPARFGPAVSPHLAAAMAGVDAPRVAPLAAHARALAAGADVLVTEGVGGLLVPLNDAESVRDLAVALGLPLVVAARPGLGTINHCLLTVEAARAAGLDVRAVVLTPWPAAPGAIERSNRETVARLADVEVAVLEPTTPARLAAAGAGLAYERWLA